MRLLNRNFDLEKFYADLGRAQKPALLLDYDGTLSPFQAEREQAVPYPGVSERLDSIIASGHTHLVIISGRRANELTDLLRLKQQPEIWGSHGNERLMSNGEYHLAQIARAEVAGLKQAAVWARQEGLVECMEGKPAGLAFHWRGLDEDSAALIRRKVVDKWTPLLDQYGLKLMDFDGGIEIKVSSRDKGNAVRRIMTELGEGAVIAYLGDDLTDEDAFAVLRGTGLNVIVREKLRETAADLWLQPPEELLAFLEKWDRIRRANNR
jgi:trehalose 6-phosphate phosphatase